MINLSVLKTVIRTENALIVSAPVHQVGQENPVLLNNANTTAMVTESVTMDYANAIKDTQESFVNKE